jgi:DNA-binding transcriptional regulator YhcF (GntR family)
MIKNFVADAEEAGVSRRQIADMVNEKADNYLTLYGV